MAQTSIHIEPCNIGSAERHNLRSKELDYIRKELSHLNESWVGSEIAPCLEDIRERYKNTTGQNMQKKATPIREGVVVIEQGTTMQQLHYFAQRLQERWGIKTIQIHLHKDEGYTKLDATEEWKPNLHAHLIFNWTDDNGKSFKLKKQDMAEMQTLLAECLKMERGISSDRKHLNAIQYKAMKEAERVIELEQRAKRAESITQNLPELEEEYQTALENYDTAKDNLEQAEQRLQALKKDIREAEVKKSASKAGKAILGAIERTFSSKKMEGLETEVKELVKENTRIRREAEKEQMAVRENMARVTKQKDGEIAGLQEELKEIQRYFPTMESAGRNIKQLRKLGIPEEKIPGLLLGRELVYSGNLYDQEHRYTHQVKDVSVHIAPSTRGGMFVWLNGKNVVAFFRELWEKLKQSLGLDKEREQGLKQSRGFHL